MTPDRKYPTVAFWITVALVALLVGYPLSFGPAIWFDEFVRARIPNEQPQRWVANAIQFIYRPIMLARDDGPQFAWDAYWWYLGLWVEVHPENIHHRAR